MRNGNQIRIVDDQINNPTYLDDLALAALKSADMQKYGLFHIGGNELLNRYEFTLKIAEFFELDKKLIIPIKTSELNQKAKRPLKSGLVIDKAKQELNYIPTSLIDTFELMRVELKL